MEGMLKLAISKEDNLSDMNVDFPEFSPINSSPLDEELRVR